MPVPIGAFGLRTASWMLRQGWRRYGRPYAKWYIKKKFGQLGQRVGKRYGRIGQIGTELAGDALLYKITSGRKSSSLKPARNRTRRRKRYGRR